MTAIQGQSIQSGTISVNGSSNSCIEDEAIFPDGLVMDTLDLQLGASEPVTPLDNPALREYPAHFIETVIDELNEFAGPRGYCIVIRRSKKDINGKVSNVDLCCDRSRKFESTVNENTRKRRRTSTQRIECPWRCYLKRRDNPDIEDSSIWTLCLPKGETEWRYHNHPPSETEAAHRTIRRTAFRGKLGDEIRKFFALRTLKPSDIYHTLHQLHGDAPITQKDIYNLLYSWRRAQRKGMSSTQAIIHELNQSPDWFVRWWPTEGPIERLFFTHKDALDLLRYNYDVLIMDCTYNTNRFRMKLLDIVGITKLNRTYYAAFCLLTNEDTESFDWALRHLGYIYQQYFQVSAPTTVIIDHDHALLAALADACPNTNRLLCIWHIEKGILRHCKPLLIQETILEHASLSPGERASYTNQIWKDFLSNWNKIVYAPTEKEFKNEWKAFQQKYSEFRRVILYIQDTWMVCRESWATAWTGSILHLQQRATSRSEGAHYKIKSILDGHNDLTLLVHRIQLLIQRQHREETVETERQRANRDTELFCSSDNYTSERASDINISLFRDLWGHVSLYAIRQANDQYSEFRRCPGPLQKCSQTFSKSTGFPCKHTIRERMSKSESLQPSDFHPHWRFFRGQRQEISENALQIYLPISDPIIPSARYERYTKTTSTGRIQSGFEKVEDCLATTIQSGAQNPSSSKQPVSGKKTQRAQRAPAMCSGCGSTKHTFRTCPTR